MGSVLVNTAGGREWPLVAQTNASAFFRNYTNAVAEAKAGFLLIGTILLDLVWAVQWLRGSWALPGFGTFVVLTALWLALIRYWAAGPYADRFGAADLNGKLAIVTGCNTGIGRETVKGLWSRGATVVLACRDVAKANAAVDYVAGQSADRKRLHVLKLDTSSLASVREFAAAFSEQFGADKALDLLINNAGISSVAAGFKKSVDGMELTAATNHFGHFLLTQLLMDNLLRAAAANPFWGRVVQVSSIGSTTVKPSDTVDGILGLEVLKDPTKFDGFPVYAQTKLAQIMHTQQLVARYGDKGLKAYALHPGGINSDIWTENVGHQPVLSAFINVLARLTWKTTWQGAQTTLYCATDERAVNGAFHSDCMTWTVLPLAVDPDKCKELWEKSAAITKAP